jgi:O-antigen/teichoic acid export membrane protein
MRRTSRNLLHVIGGEMLLRVANFGVAILVGRIYGAAILGAYAAILAAATLAERLADNGLELSGIVEVSRHPENLDRIATALYINKTLFSILAITALATLGWATGLSRTHWIIAGILTPRTFLYSYCRLNAGLLKALDKAQQIARIQFVHSLLLCSAILYVLLRGKSLAFLLLCLLAAQLVELLLSLRTLRNLGARFGAASPGRCWELARRSTPIGLTYTLSTLMLRGDVLVLSLLATASAVGAFAAADTGLVIVYVVAWLFSGVLLADLNRITSNQGEFDEHFRKCIVAILAFGIPVAVGSVLLAPSAIHLLYGSRFAAAGVPAAIMAVAAPFIFLNAAFLSRSVARNATSLCLAVNCAGAALSLTLNFLLGWRYAGTGIAISIVIREMTITLAFLHLKNVPPTIGESAAPLKTDRELVEVLNA